MLKIEASIEEVNIILAALSKQPYEVVSTLISNIHSQAKEQLAPKEQSKEKKDKK